MIQSLSYIIETFNQRFLLKTKEGQIKEYHLFQSHFSTSKINLSIILHFKIEIEKYFVYVPVM